MKTPAEQNKTLESITLKGIVILAIIGCLMGISACSQCSGDTKTKKVRVEKLKKEISKKLETGEGTLKQIDSLHNQIRKLKWQIIRAEPFWKGRPYEKIINELAKHYNLVDYENYVPGSTHLYKTILDIYPSDTDPDKHERAKWNMEDVSKIKNIIIKTLQFEPKVDKYSTMNWTTSKFDIEIAKNGAGDIRIEFMTKK